jgi:hypothetical protein
MHHTASFSDHVEDVMMTSTQRDGGVLAVVRYDDGSYGLARGFKPLALFHWPEGELPECVAAFDRLIESVRTSQDVGKPIPNDLRFFDCKPPSTFS